MQQCVLIRCVLRKVTLPTFHLSTSVKYLRQMIIKLISSHQESLMNAFSSGVSKKNNNIGILIISHISSSSQISLLSLSQRIISVTCKMKFYLRDKRQQKHALKLKTQKKALSNLSYPISQVVKLTIGTTICYTIMMKIFSTQLDVIQ